MLKFVEEFCSKNKDYSFKGGNLLWFYISTERATVDLDFASKLKLSKEEVIAQLESVIIEGVSFGIKNVDYKEIQGCAGIGVDILFETTEGAKNKFSIDMVLGIDTDNNEIKMFNKSINAATIENVICDKLDSCQRHGSGTTRFKDYDDLFTILENNFEKINIEKLKVLSKTKDIDLKIPLSVLNERMLDEWPKYISKQYKKQTNLPQDLSLVIEIINKRLNK